MTISVKQLEILAEHFHFDINEARQVIGLPVKPVKPEKPVKAAKQEKPRSDSSVSGFYKPSSQPAPKNKETTKKNGYTLFLSNCGMPYKEALAKWRVMSKEEKLIWNNRT